MATLKSVTYGDTEYEVTSNEAYSIEYDDATKYLELKLDGTVASTVDLSQAVAKSISEGITTDHIDGLLYLYPRLEEGITREKSNITGGNYFSPRNVTRSNGSVIMCLPVGSIVAVKCSSTFQNLIGKDYIEAGETFDVTNALANSGSAPYIVAIKGGNVTETNDIESTLKKRFLGAGNYMALGCAEFTSKASWVLVQKIGANVT